MTVEVVIPGLFGPVADIPNTEELPRLPFLEKLLARADQSASATGYSETLTGLFGIRPPKTGDTQTAAIRYLADTGHKPQGYMMQADPVHLYPDNDRLLVFDAHNFDISQSDAQAFATVFNQHFSDQGYRLEAPHPKRWYLSVSTEAPDPSLTTVELDQVVGRNMQHFLPQGEDARIWIKLLNEIQMLFYSLPVNDEREQIGAPRVSGLWLSGAGRLPSVAQAGFSQCYGDCALLKGLAGLSGTALEETLADEVREDSLLVIKDLHRAVLDTDVSAWLAGLAFVEGLLQDLDSQHSEFLLYPCNGRQYHYRSAHRWRIWRPRRPLWDCLDINY